MIKRNTTYYLLLGILFNVIALLLPASHVAAPSRDHWLVVTASAVSVIFTALALRSMYVRWRR